MDCPLGAATEAEIGPGWPSRKIDLNWLVRDVRERPDDDHSQGAARFGVSQNAICQALRKLGLTNTKTPDPLQGG